MSVWKKAAKAHQKTHKERHQLEERAHLGLLEKKKDYVKRAQDYNEKQATLKVLHKRALNKNPDEFYHHMINSKIDNGKHVEKQTDLEDSPQQLKLMQTQDLKYVITKRTQELRKIDKLQAELHFTSVDRPSCNKHVFFDKKGLKMVGKGAKDAHKGQENVQETLLEVHMQEIDEKLMEKGARTIKQRYNELAKRVERERELAVIQQKIQLKKHLMDKKALLKPKKVRKGNKDSAAVYLWKYERKK